MRLVVTEFITLDGDIEDPGGSEKTPNGGWAFRFDRGPDGDKFKLDELMDADAQLLGRKTYEGFAAAWPSMKDDVGFADRMNSMPKYVVSSSPLDPEWENSTRLEGDLESAVPELKGRYTGDILVAGSRTLVQSLTALGLVDEYRLMVYPVLLGAGKRLFAEDGDQSALRMVASQSAGDCMILTYVPKEA